MEWTHCLSGKDALTLAAHSCPDGTSVALSEDRQCLCAKAHSVTLVDVVTSEPLHSVGLRLDFPGQDNNVNNYL